MPPTVPVTTRALNGPNSSSQAGGDNSGGGGGVDVPVSRQANAASSYRVAILKQAQNHERWHRTVIRTTQEAEAEG